MTVTDEPAAAAARKPRRSAEQRRAQILAAARPLFAERGFHGTTTRDLAEAAGVNDALLYRYFANKQDILKALMDEAVAVFESLPEPPAQLPIALELLLTFAGEAFVGKAKDNLDLLTILISEARTLDGETRFVEFVDRAAGRLATLIDRAAGGCGREDGLHRGYLTARAYFGALISFVLLQDQLGLDRIRPLDASEYVRHLARLTARGVQA